MLKRKVFCSVAIVCCGSIAFGQVNGTIGKSGTVYAGTNGGFVKVYAPDPVQPGSSISHWDPSATPDLLMEPFATGASTPPDLTDNAYRDMGWPTGGPAPSFIINNYDGAGEGLNDPTPPAAGQTGGGCAGATSLGDARLCSLQAAANFWGNVINTELGSAFAGAWNVYVDSFFDPLTCGAGGAVLGAATTQFVFRDFTGAPQAGTWFAESMANAIAGSDLCDQFTDPNCQSSGFPIGEMYTVYNSDLDNGCLPGAAGFFYDDGTATAPPDRINFYEVAVHEFGHGLGFASYTDESTGQFFSGFPTIYDHCLYDLTMNDTWNNMTASQIQQSATNTGNLVWNCPDVTNDIPNVLDNHPVLVINSPASLAGEILAGGAEFGPALQLIPPGNVTDDLALAEDNTAPDVNDACETVDPSVSGMIAVIRRGNCAFVTKVKNAQDAGAVGAVVVNNDGDYIMTMGGTDPSITIPSVFIPQTVGENIITVLSRVNYLDIPTVSYKGMLLLIGIIIAASFFLLRR